MLILDVIIIAIVMSGADNLFIITEKPASGKLEQETKDK